MYSARLIAKKLCIPRSTVHDTIVRYQETGLHNDRRRNGRPKATSAAEGQSVQLISKENRRLTAPEIRADFNCGRLKDLSLSTVKRVLRSRNLFGRVAVLKPLLRPINRLKRLNWSQTHINWTSDDWSKVLWTEESNFEIFGQNREFSSDDQLKKICCQNVLFQL